jgi:hypothetical protein
MWALMGLLLYAIAFGPMGGGGLRKAPESDAMQRSRTIALAMFQYSIDNGACPTGKSSTEAFQKLLDGNYVTDPALFCMPLHGKYPAKQGEKLKPENVAFDITADVTDSAPDGLPLVFLTGYRIEYKPDGRAIPLGPPLQLRFERTWEEWWRGDSLPALGIAVAFKSNETVFLRVDPKTDLVLHLIDPKTDFAGKTYRQLTPEGELPPP